MKKIPKREFWVTNISTTRDVSLADLRLTIRRGESRNLLDDKHYTYTEAQLEASYKSGSLYAKRASIKVRDVAPQMPVQPGKYISKGNRVIPPLRAPSVKIVNKTYDDLDFLDEKDAAEKFALADADIAFNEHGPSTLAVDKKLTGAK